MSRVPVLPVPTEEQEQIIVVDWLEWHRICFIHPANESKRTRIQGGRLKRIGMAPGIPDLLIFDPPPVLRQAKGAAIELKRQKGGRLSDLQREWIERLRKRGWLVAVCMGADEAIRTLEGWGYGR